MNYKNILIALAVCSSTLLATACNSNSDDEVQEDTGLSNKKGDNNNNQGGGTGSSPANDVPSDPSQVNGPDNGVKSKNDDGNGNGEEIIEEKAEKPAPPAPPLTLSQEEIAVLTKKYETPSQEEIAALNEAGKKLLGLLKAQASEALGSLAGEEELENVVENLSHFTGADDQKALEKLTENLKGTELGKKLKEKQDLEGITQVANSYSGIYNAYQSLFEFKEQKRNTFEKGLGRNKNKEPRSVDVLKLVNKVLDDDFAAAFEAGAEWLLQPRQKKAKAHTPRVSQQTSYFQTRLQEVREKAKAVADQFKTIADGIGESEEALQLARTLASQLQEVFAMLDKEELEKTDYKKAEKRLNEEVWKDISAIKEKITPENKTKA